MIGNLPRLADGKGWAHGSMFCTKMEDSKGFLY